MGFCTTCGEKRFNFFIGKNTTGFTVVESCLNVPEKLGIRMVLRLTGGEVGPYQLAHQVLGCEVVFPRGFFEPAGQIVLKLEGQGGYTDAFCF